MLTFVSSDDEMILLCYTNKQWEGGSSDVKCQPIKLKHPTLHYYYYYYAIDNSNIFSLLVIHGLLL
jgi:hypothetical protein